MDRHDDAVQEGAELLMALPLREAIQMKEFIDRKLGEGATLVLRWNAHCYQNVEYR